MKAKPILQTQDELNELFVYNPLNGKLYNRIHLGTRARQGQEAGTLSAFGYRTVVVASLHHMAHRIIWKMVHGSDPVEQMDHINHQRDDNRMENLREVTPLENQRNASMGKNNTSGVTGVHWEENRQQWKATIMVEEKLVFLGRFIHFWKAVRARKLAEIGYGFHQNHGQTA